jgi:hypothetical protein
MFAVCSLLLYEITINVLPIAANTHILLEADRYMLQTTTTTAAAQRIADSGTSTDHWNESVTG